MKFLMWYRDMILWLCFLSKWSFSSPPSRLVWPPRIIPGFVAAIFNPLSFLPYDGTLPLEETWLIDLLDVLVCPRWRLYQLRLRSIILSAEGFHNPCQPVQYSTPAAEIRLLHPESPDLIRKGAWPETTTLLSSPLLSSPLLSSPLLSSPLLSSQPCLWHLSKTIPVSFPSGQEPPHPIPAPVTGDLPLPLFCFRRAPIRKCLLQLSWWGWSRRGHTRPWRGRKGSALPLSPSVLTENYRSCLHWQVCLFSISIGAVTLFYTFSSKMAHVYMLLHFLLEDARWPLSTIACLSYMYEGNHINYS